ncbi:hypothetical protein Y1Q_0007292 [Alligator mississippiensis]|uniref:ribonuclease H n=1 Tax=Alligator mississippiensis TaxID=8496 RepID=A0A151NN28_ALLMI|nr:hypothetical protein Y1Q_0007292 [Alligator mississippiensis]
MPHVAELVERTGDTRYISNLDLAKGYWQIPVAKEDWLKTAFGTPWGLNEFFRMPFGLHGAAATFQRLMDQILAPHADQVRGLVKIISTLSRRGTLQSLKMLEVQKNHFAVVSQAAEVTEEDCQVLDTILALVVTFMLSATLPCL